MLEHHNGGVDGVFLDPPEKLLDQQLPGVNLQGLLLVKVVVSLHVLALRIVLRLNDLLHVSSPVKPKNIHC